MKYKGREVSTNIEDRRKDPPVYPENAMAIMTKTVLVRKKPAKRNLSGK